MSQRLKRIFIILNVFFFVCLVATILIPTATPKVEISNTDTSTTITKIGAITNSRNIQLEFELYNEELYGITLYFCPDGEDESGEVTCTLKRDGKVLAQDSVSVKELFVLAASSGLNGKEFKFGKGIQESGEYVVELSGSGISDATRIALYGNDDREQNLKLGDDLQVFDNPLYMIEVWSYTYPYIWYAALILALCMMCSYVVYINFYLADKEKSCAKNRK